MSAQLKTRRPVDPTGRLDIAVASLAVRLLDQVVERYLPEARNLVAFNEKELRKLLVKTPLGPRNRKARFVRDVVREVLPTVRRLKR